MSQDIGDTQAHGSVGSGVVGFLHMALQNKLGTGFGSAVTFISP